MFTNAFLNLIFTLSFSSSLQADVTLPHVFSSHMVLQRDAKLPVWGWAEAGEEITVQLGDAEPLKTKTDDEGNWRVTLPSQQTGKPTTLKVTGKNSIVLEDILIGEVWLCSGQSNMQWSVQRSLNPEEEIKNANYPEIRLLSVPLKTASQPQKDFAGEWKVCTPTNIPNFSACAYFMGRELRKELKVPVGLINSSWGGTRIEPWTPPVGFSLSKDLADIHQLVLLSNPFSPDYQKKMTDYLGQVGKWIETSRKAVKESTTISNPPAMPMKVKPLKSNREPTTLYNAMIHPLIPFAIRGAIWYQGESNHREGKLYTSKMLALVEGWRTVWNQGSFPFNYVQIAPYGYGKEWPSILAEFWDAQTAALSIKNTGMVVTSDIGNIRNIHPTNKQEVGRRLALIALNNTYGKKEVVFEGPKFKEFKPEGATLKVVFENTAGGLKTKDGKPPTWFEVIGLETDFEQATAKIEGDSVVLSSPKVNKPLAMRFAWHKNAEPNLHNGAGLPAYAFRAGDVPKRDYLALNVPEAKGYKLVYSLDLSKLSTAIKYDIDNSKEVTGAFDRIAYFIELKKQGAPMQFAFVSLDAFTSDVTKIGIPNVASKAKFQLKVNNLSVLSNVPGISKGVALKGGNIEFWPNNYGPNNSANIPGASTALWDFGDVPSDPVNGYGCMQVHNHLAKQTIFSINRWNGGAGADLGIGNSKPGAGLKAKTRDWTFAGNAGQYTQKHLRVLVRMKIE